MSVIQTMCQSGDVPDVCTAMNAISNAADLVHAELLVYLDLRCFTECYGEAVKFYNHVVMSESAFRYDKSGYMAEHLELILEPLDMLCRLIDSSEYSDEDFDNAVDYWENHDTDEYLEHFEDAYDVSDHLRRANAIERRRIRKQMKLDIDTMITAYFNHP